MKTKTDPYAVITKRLLELMEAGTIPWRKTWSSSSFPKSLATGKEYRGINAFVLSLTQGMEGYASSYWCTFNQAKALGGSVKKGQHGTQVAFWKFFDPSKDKAEPTAQEETLKKKRRFFLRTYTVFNLDQTENVAVPPRFLPVIQDGSLAPLPMAEQVVDRYAGPGSKGPTIWHGGASAFYSPPKDEVKLPPLKDFFSAEEYYATLFHELSHSTGHSSRLNRKGVTDPIAFGSHTYADEELVAEFSATFLCSRLGLARDPMVENAAAYLRNWSSVLKADPKIIVYAAQRAQKAADWILNGGSQEKEEEEGAEGEEASQLAVA